MITSWKRRSRSHPLRVGALAGAAAALLLATACGAGSSGATNTAGLTGTPIKIGLMANVSGPSGAADGAAAKVFQAWAADTNANGGIAGHPVEVVLKDTRGDSPTAAAAAEELVGDDSVAAVVHVSAATDGAVGQILSDGGLAVTGGAGYNPRVWGKLKNWFGITTTFPSVVNMQVAAAKPAGATNLAVLACSEDPSCVSAIPLFEAAAKTAGTTYSGTVQVSTSAPNYTAECLDLVHRQANFVQLSVISSVGSKVAQNCATQGYTGFFGASASSVAPELYGTPGIKLAGGLHGFPWWVDDAPVKHFRDVMAAQGVADKDWGGPGSTALWATGVLFAKTMAKAVGAPDTQVTRQMVVDAYGKVSGETLDGLLPQPITFTANQPAAPVNCYWLYRFENGEFEGTFAPSCPS